MTDAFVKKEGELAIVGPRSEGGSELPIAPEINERQTESGELARATLEGADSGPLEDETSLEEKVHSREEVMAVLNQQLDGQPYRIERELSDAKGLYLLDIVIPGEDGNTEYSYRRQGVYPKGIAKISVIHVAYYDKDGFPVGGTSVAKWKNGVWKISE
ncbi:hypothetical protein C0416_04775 [bacterium]|nr:hypothetical protein [bacterium]